MSLDLAILSAGPPNPSPQVLSKTFAPPSTAVAAAAAAAGGDAKSVLNDSAKREGRREEGRQAAFPAPLCVVFAVAVDD